MSQVSKGTRLPFFNDVRTKPKLSRAAGSAVVAPQREFLFVD